MPKPVVGSQIASLIAAGLFLVGLGLTYRATTKTISLQVDGRITRVHTHARNVGAVLREHGFDPSPADRVTPDLDEPTSDGATIVVDSARPVVLETPGGVQLVWSAERLPANILHGAGIKLYPADRLWVDGIPVTHGRQMPETPVSRIRIVPATPVTLLASPRQGRQASSAPTIGEALWEAGEVLHEADRLEPAVSRPLGANTLIWEASAPVQIQVDGRLLRSRVIASTVGQALLQAGVPLAGLDRAEPAESEPLPADGYIRVRRIREAVVSQLEPVPFETEYQPLPDLELDQKRVLDTGSYGLRVNQVRLRFEGGEEVERLLEGEWMARQPEPRVVGYGTNIVVRSLATADGTIEYWRAVQMWATSYSPSRAGVSPDAKNFGITASGRPLKKGLVAIDRSLIPFGTSMYVPGYGFALAADTGGGVRGRWIDLGYEDDNWVSWAKYVTVYFLTPIPSPENIVWIFP